MTEIKIPEYYSLPVKYSIEPFEDDRFMKVRFKFINEGVNFNKSSFGMDAIQDAEDTITNIPILAFVKKREDGETDFGEHEIEIQEDENGSYKVVYLEKPIGVIPTNDNNYHYEEFDGVTYGIVDGYIWKEYAQDEVDILERDQTKKMSMEIKILRSEYDFKSKILDIKKYKYLGLTLLGDEYGTGIPNAKVEVLNFSKENANKYFKMLEEIITALHLSFKNKNNINSKKEVELMALTSAQMRSELSRLCRSEKYKDDDWYGWEYTRYYMEDYDENFVYCYDNMHSYMCKIPYSMSGDDPKINFEGASRVKITYTDWEGGTEEKENFVKAFREEVKGLFDKELENREEKFSKEKEQFTSQIEELNKEKDEFKQKEEQFTKEKEDLVKEKDEFAKQITEKDSQFKEVSEKYNTLEQETTELKTYKENKVKEEKQFAVDAVLGEFGTKLTNEEVETFKQKGVDMELQDFIKEVKLFVFDKENKDKFNFTSNKPKLISMGIDIGKVGGEPTTVWDKYKR